MKPSEALPLLASNVFGDAEGTDDRRLQVEALKPYVVEAGGLEPYEELGASGF
jgi:hypothetical protein